MKDLNELAEVAERDAQRFCDVHEKIKREVQRFIVGQEPVLDAAVTALYRALFFRGGCRDRGWGRVSFVLRCRCGGCLRATSQSNTARITHSCHKCGAVVAAELGQDRRQDWPAFSEVQLVQPRLRRDAQGHVGPGVQ